MSRATIEAVRHCLMAMRDGSDGRPPIEYPRVHVDGRPVELAWPDEPIVVWADTRTPFPGSAGSIVEHKATPWDGNQ